VHRGPHRKTTVPFLVRGMSATAPSSLVVGRDDCLTVAMCSYYYFLLLHSLDGYTTMRDSERGETVCFTIKGQIVIPSRLRKLFHIQEGTRAVVTATPEGILLKPVTRYTVQRLHGILKRKPGGKSFAKEWAEHKKAERGLEEAKLRRHGSR
jgi:AbrB family looped-hinge helix DNA binding protein